MQRTTTTIFGALLSTNV